ncbi:sugar-transfer associated ATP-grasp domain-containing protein [Marinobacterium jannaschii]|uniref:sugar-transfer associated ATP-grasp domain-containing protein n=1 Tax=Marinobacterium jannaschii TaxID=64970 RepID=UPI0006845B78|nr:sugar-transfer associated ATP-grasp domain-containing protein [Marinobacterium jannaschii]
MSKFSYKWNMKSLDYVKDFLRYAYYMFFNGRHKFNMRRYRDCKVSKPAPLMKKELKELRAYWGCVPMQYYTHDFYRSDCELGLEEMKAYIPGYYFYNILYPRYDDTKTAKGALENKILSYYVFKGMSLPVPKMVAFKKGGKLLTPEGTVIDEVQFNDILSSVESRKLFIKPVDGKGGVGINIAIKKGGEFFICDVLVGLKYILGLSGDFVIEEQVEQISFLNDVYPHSVNTLRAVTKRNFTGNAELIAVTLRMGTAGRQVDNSHLGGLLIGIDLLTGKAMRPYAGYEYGSDKIFNHPDTKFDFGNMKIEGWDHIKGEIVSFANKMVLQNLIGWDIALTDDGPLVIEANTMFGIDHSQSGVGGMRDLFDDDLNIH